MQISEVAINKIKGSNKVAGRLMDSFDKHFRTIENWIEKNDVRLTTPSAVKIICDFTGLAESEVLVSEKVEA